MKRSVKIISIVCLIAMLIGIVPAFSVSAANEPTLKITPSATSVNVGDTFTLTVSLENNPGLWSLLVKVSVDTTAFDFVEAEFDDTIFDQGGICDFKVEEGIYEMNRNYSDSFANVTEDGVVGVITLKAKTSADIAGKYTFTATSDFDNTINSDYDCIEVAPASTDVRVNVRFAGAQITLGSDLKMKYYVQLPDKYEGAQMKLTLHVDGREPIYVNGTYDSTSNATIYLFEGIPPHCMGTKIDAELFYNGELIGAKYGYSILDNCKSIVAAYGGTKYESMAKAALNYGAAAQKFRAYDTANLVNKGYEIELLTPPESVNVLQQTNNDKSLATRFSGASVYFEDVNQINVTVVSAEKPTVTINGVEATDIRAAGEGKWKVYTEGIRVSEFGKVFTFVLTSSPNELKPTITYSVNTYAYNTVSKGTASAAMIELAKATYTYYASTK